MIYDGLARLWLDLGWHPIPLRIGTKVPAVPFADWRDNRRPDDVIVQSFRGARNFGLLVPEGSFVLDFDNHNGYMEWVMEGYDVDTYTVRTGRGYHMYFTGNQHTSRFEYGDILGPGHLVVGAPSIHPKGGRYMCINDTLPIELPSLSDIGIARNKTQLIPDDENGKTYVYSSFDRTPAGWPVTISQLVTLKGSRAYCPIHQPDNSGRPSMTYDPNSDRCYCFSTDCPVGEKALGSYDLALAMAEHGVVPPDVERHLRPYGLAA